MGVGETRRNVFFHTVISYSFDEMYGFVSREMSQNPSKGYRGIAGDSHRAIYDVASTSSYTGK
jgi:hypothetical protein